MGAWDTGNFENDDALDWISNDFSQQPSIKTIRDALKNAANFDDEGDLELPECGAAVVAAEFVAALQGKPSPELPEDVAPVLLDMKLDGKLPELALKAIARVKTNSEMQELWEESDGYKAWISVIEELESRLTPENAAS